MSAFRLMLAASVALSLATPSVARPVHHKAPALWSLVVSDGHDEYVIDHDLTIDDCAASAAVNRRHAEVYCVPQRRNSRSAR
jgi:hypothetical protein